MLTPTQYSGLIEDVKIFTYCVILQTYNTAILKLSVNVRSEVKVKECKVKVKKINKKTYTALQIINYLT